MRGKSFAVPVGSTAVAASIMGRTARADQTYLPIPGKTNNIYTNLNRQFPHTDDGTGVPGSNAGTPNATFLFDPATYTSPDAVAGGDQTTNGVSFLLASDATGHDYRVLGSSETVTIPINLANVSSVSLLGAGTVGTTVTAKITINNGGSFAFDSVDLPDYDGGGVINEHPIFANGKYILLDQTAFEVNDIGAGGTGNSATGARDDYYLYEQTYAPFPTSGANQVASVTFTATGGNPLLFGVTVMTVPEPAPLGVIGLATAALGRRCRQSRIRLAYKLLCPARQISERNGNRLPTGDRTSSGRPASE